MANCLFFFYCALVDYSVLFCNFVVECVVGFEFICVVNLSMVGLIRDASGLFMLLNSTVGDLATIPI